MREQGIPYQEPTLVLFTGEVASACGYADAAVGPFYCPENSKVYLDLGFFDELRSRFGASGDFAQAYVIAHEIGHHVQNQLGISDRVRLQMQSQGYVTPDSFTHGTSAQRLRWFRRGLESGDIALGDTFGTGTL
jgi:predicted metalloprotease